MPNLKSFAAFVTENTKSRLMSKVTKLPSGCWRYKGNKGTDHYGQIWSKGSAKIAHKVSYEAHKGKVPSGKLLMHTCDNRWCVNPAHLKPGTKKQNNDDTSRKGRSKNQHTGTLKGSPNDVGDR